jgi:hypothetical protein
MKTLIIAVAILLVCFMAPAHAVTADVLAYACSSQVPNLKKDFEKNAKKAGRKIEDYIKFCRWYIIGWDDARFAFSQRTYCPPRVTITELSLAFVDYVNTHKEVDKLRAAEALMSAFKDKWPCQSSSMVPANAMEASAQVLALACAGNVPDLPKSKTFDLDPKGVIEFCHVYLNGWDDARVAFLQGTITYCPPKITYKELSVVFFDYLATHKEARELSAAEALMVAFKDKWPCH